MTSSNFLPDGHKHLEKVSGIWYTFDTKVKCDADHFVARGAARQYTKGDEVLCQ